MVKTYRIIGISLFIICIVCMLDAKIIYVAPDGTAGGDGTGFSKACDFSTSLSKAVAGDTILLQGGTYTIPCNASSRNTISISIAGDSGKLIYVIAEDGKRALFDFSYTNNSKVLNSSVTSYGFYFESTAKYLYFRRVDITRAGYQGAYVTGSNITFDNCAFYKNWNSGIEINKGASHVTLLNCDAYGNYDSSYKNGGMADGFAVKQELGPGNRLIGCRSWENSDDGYDTYDDPVPVIFEQCWAFRNGFDQGNGNGFKVGGSPNKDVGQKNILKCCVAFGNLVKGFDQNNNIAGVTLYNCTSYGNGTNYGFGGNVTDGLNVIRNCISLSGKNPDAFGISLMSNNTWSDGLTVSVSDFESVDTSLATKPRNPDGSLPQTGLFRLKSGSKLVNAGIEVGIPFVGSKPDVGAFEFGSATSIAKTQQNIPHSLIAGQNFKNNNLVISLNSSTADAIVNIYSLNGNKVNLAVINSGWELDVNCSSLVSGQYITVLHCNGVKQQMLFKKY